jgi:hypothetical protein
MSQKQKPTSTNDGSSVLDELQSFIEKVTALVGQPPALTAADIKRSAKLRKGGETVIPTVAALSDRFGLSIPSHPTSDMVAKMTKAQSLIPLHRGLVAATKQVGDAIFQAQSQSWGSATVHYSTLRRLARSDGDVAKTLAPVTQFFAAKSPTVVEAEDAKRGGKKGSKAAKSSKSSKPAEGAPAVVEASGSSGAATPAASPAAATPTAAATTAPTGATHS